MPCVPGGHGGQKRVPDMLVLELQTIVSRHVGAGAQPGAARAAISPAPWETV